MSRASFLDFTFHSKQAMIYSSIPAPNPCNKVDLNLLTDRDPKEVIPLRNTTQNEQNGFIWLWNFPPILVIGIRRILHLRVLSPHTNRHTSVEATHTQAQKQYNANRVREANSSATVQTIIQPPRLASVKTVPSRVFWAIKLICLPFL